jgi:hypothetical protein
VPGHTGANTRAGELAADRVGGATFEELGENRNRQGGRAGDEQVHVIGFAVELDQLDIEFCRMVCSQEVSIVSVNTGAGTG